MATLIRLLQRLPPLLAWVNRLVIGRLASGTAPRPYAFSLWSPTQPGTPAPQRFVQPRARPPVAHGPDWVSDYTSWPGLADRSFTSRHLPPRDAESHARLPHMDAVVALFDRRGEMRPNATTTALFCFFAQWFTDSFLRTHPTDPRRTTSNHEIDLCQIYGLDEPSTWALRAGVDGRLKSRLVGGQAYPCLLYAGGELDRQFFDPDPIDEVGLTYLRGGRAGLWAAGLERSLPGATTDPQRRDWFYASGLDRGGSTIVYSAFNTVFLREHNRIAGVLRAAYPHWDDNRWFETARLVNIRQMLTVVINDYITHIGGSFPFKLDRSFAEGARWYRANRISIEFDLLYRWHSLVPDTLVVEGRTLHPHDYRYNNALLEQWGVERVISAASMQPAGRIGLGNTPGFLRTAERHGLHWAREFRVRGFNDYRERFKMPRYTSIEAFADDAATADAIRAVYGDNPDDVELTVGLFAEKRGLSDVMPATVRAMVAYDAFTHILTNPVLASDVHNERTFSEVGWDIVGEQATLAQIVRRNTDPARAVSVSLALPGFV